MKKSRIHKGAKAVFFFFLSNLAPNNKNLEPNSYYTLFIRVYVTNNLYTSTGWYPIALTSDENNAGNKKTITKDEEKCKLSLRNCRPESLGKQTQWSSVFVKFWTKKTALLRECFQGHEKGCSSCFFLDL